MTETFCAKCDCIVHASGLIVAAYIPLGCKCARMDHHKVFTLLHKPHAHMANISAHISSTRADVVCMSICGWLTEKAVQDIRSAVTALRTKAAYTIYRPTRMALLELSRFQARAIPLR